MNDRTRTLLFLGGLLLLLVLFFSRILFTHDIIRAPDIISEFYWTIKDAHNGSFADLFRIHLAAYWDPIINSGTTTEGGDASLAFLLFKKLVFWAIPAPASIGWFIVFHLFFGAAGVYCCCRAIGASQWGALLGGLVFALAPEIASLINAGHVMKIATISYAPWAFFFLERGFQSRRLFYFLTSAFVLAFQFFNTHWQVAYYTCLCVGAYGVFRLIGLLRSADTEERQAVPKLLGMNVALLVFFLTTVAISLMPLANWSKETNRGVQSGASQQQAGQVTGSSAKGGGLNADEAMAWSLPPEEVATFIIPGMFGFSRQEGGDNPPSIKSYYWGRTIFTQTNDYMGLLPWLLIPLVYIFRRDRYTWLATGGIVGGLLFSMGKYTPFYWALYYYFPGINHFRVPKMIMFIPVIALAVLAARGLDLLMDPEVRSRLAFRRYLYGLGGLALLLMLTAGVTYGGSSWFMSQLYDVLSQPTRYEQGEFLVGQRWGNLVGETAIAALLTVLYGLAIWLVPRWRNRWALPVILLILLVADTWRINDKFMFLVPPPGHLTATQAPSPLMDFLSTMPKTYRALPTDDPMPYATRGIPVMFTSNAVQRVRWQTYLDNFNLGSAMPDMLNIKYLIMPQGAYEEQKAAFGTRFIPVFSSPDGKVVIENRTVMPKAWLSASVAVAANPAQIMTVLQNQGYNPLVTSLVETASLLPFPRPDSAPVLPQNVAVQTYEGNRIVLNAAPVANALLVLGDKYYPGWRATVDGKPTDIVPVNYLFRGVYLTPGTHTVEFVFDPTPFKIGKWLTLVSFALFAVMLVRELRGRWLVRGER